ncbi:lipopolysaccharide biosynthesis protein [Alkalihalobacterium elongatum]|uniref:lipopolysaccharide biosynthesis protein n=1 Tax=Alkalihalobacterium elongatum TaxID=2675466 RepID=UPI001C201513|nr:oligosaccharide flippase family protein [Alkalihalobacterium elongatum]
MRVKYSLLNIVTGLGSQVIITSLSFISRTIFITYLGIEYLGISGLFTSILAMLALAEAGIGASIVYSLYKPVADNDQEKINVLMKLYRNAYLVIALIVLLLGLAIMPFLDFFINDTSIENIHLIYFIFLVNTVLPYFYLHKNSFLSVCQKTYIVTGIYSASSIVTVCIKIAILYYTQNFILYLVVESVITLITSIILAIIVNRMYPFLKNKVTTKLDEETKGNIIRNIKAIVLQNIGVYLVFGTDNIIISAFVSITAVGIYSNYHMLIEICRTFVNQVFNNIYHSVGNLVAKENREKVYSIYKVTQLLNFWLYSLFTIFLCIMLEPFISIWIGSEYLMSNSVLILLMVIFYERGMRNSISTVKTTSGIFHEDRYAPLCQAAVNLGISIVLVQHIGIAGVFIGTLVSALVVPFWVTPYLVYKKVFNKPLIIYFTKYVFYLVIGIGTYYITSYISNLITPTSFLTLIQSGLVCLIIPNLIYIAVFHKTSEFKYLFSIIRNILTMLQDMLKNRTRTKKSA